MHTSDLDETRPVSPQPAAEPTQETSPAPKSGDAPGEETLPPPAHPEAEPAGETRPTPIKTETPSGSEAPPPPAGEAPSGPEVLPTPPMPPVASAAVPPVEETPGEKPSRGMPWIVWAFFGLLALALIAAMSAYGGYQSAVGQRQSARSTGVAQDAKTQYDLAMQDLAAGRCDFARQRLEYVIGLDPAHPGAIDKLAEAIVQCNITATPTPLPTATVTPTPTPNLSAINGEELYVRAQQLLAGGDWSGAIDTLLALRKLDPTLYTVQVDGMLYIALRNRGVDKISLQADLEGGTYDLALAERFGLLDVEAKNWRAWAELYIRGARFWEIDWGKVILYFGELAPMAPNLRDGSGWTATDRYRIALYRYGDWLAAHGDWCGAQAQYELALQLYPSPTAEPTATYAAEQCASPTEGAPIEGDTPTPPTEGPPIESTPTPPAEETPTPEATATSSNPYP